MSLGGVLIPFKCNAWNRWYGIQPYHKRRRMTSTEERVLAHAVAAGIELPAIKVRRSRTQMFKTSSRMRMGKLVLAHAVAAGIEPPANQVRRNKPYMLCFKQCVTRGVGARARGCRRHRPPRYQSAPTTALPRRSLSMT